MDLGVSRAGSTVTYFRCTRRLQEETYLVQHEVSKRHGKLKGKHLRHALNWHNVVCGYHQSDPHAWPTTVTAASLRAAEILGGYCEQVAEVITKFAAEIQKRETAAKEDKTEKKDGRTQGNHIDALRRMWPLEQFCSRCTPSGWTPPLCARIASFVIPFRGWRQKPNSSLFGAPCRCWSACLCASVVSLRMLTARSGCLL